MIANLSDVWKVETFDEDLTAELRAHAKLIRSYMMTDRRHYLEREASDHTMPYPANPYGMDYMEFVEKVGSEMEARTIRAWHYTRLMDAEVDIIRGNGIYPSTLETIRRRLDIQVAAGVFSAETAAALFAASPLNFDKHQLEARSNKFWMTSHPHRVIGDSRVRLLLGNWGGESVYFWLQDAALRDLVASTGLHASSKWPCRSTRRATPIRLAAPWWRPSRERLAAIPTVKPSIFIRYGSWV